MQTKYLLSFFTKEKTNKDPPVKYFNKEFHGGVVA